MRSSSVIGPFFAPRNVDSGTVLHVDTVERTCAYMASCCGVKAGDCGCLAFGEGAVNGILVGPVVTGGGPVAIGGDLVATDGVDATVEMGVDVAGACDEADTNEASESVEVRLMGGRGL